MNIEQTEHTSNKSQNGNLGRLQLPKSRAHLWRCGEDNVDGDNAMKIKSEVWADSII